jgi:membrane protein implicated in regulation of membrane protease activity
MRGRDAEAVEASARKLAAALYVSGVITLAVGILLGLAFSALYFLIAAFAIIDFVLARLYETGRIGPLAGRREAEASGDAATVAESDPDYNPYARED